MTIEHARSASKCEGGRMGKGKLEIGYPNSSKGTRIEQYNEAEVICKDMRFFNWTLIFDLHPY